MSFQNELQQLRGTIHRVSKVGHTHGGVGHKHRPEIHTLLWEYIYTVERRNIHTPSYTHCSDIGTEKHPLGKTRSDGHTYRGNNYTDMHAVGRVGIEDTGWDAGSLSISASLLLGETRSSVSESAIQVSR